MGIDSHRLARPVVDEVDLGQADQNRVAIAQLELRLDAAADDLFGRNSVHSFHPRTHELDAAPRHDEGLEAVRPQEAEQLQHRLVGHLGEEPAGLRVPGSGDPVTDDAAELIGRHAGVRGHDDLPGCLLTTGQRRLHVALEKRRKGLLFLPLGMLGRERLDPIEGEECLEVDGLLGPQGAVVVEDGDALGGQHEVRRAGRPHCCHESHDRLLRSAFIPRWQWIRG